MAQPAVVQRVAATCFAGLLALATADARAQTGIIRGRIVDSAGSPVAGARVTIPRLNRSALTDSLGRTTFRALQAGDLELSIHHIGYRPETTHLRISGGSVD